MFQPVIISTRSLAIIFFVQKPDVNMKLPLRSISLKTED